MSKKPTTTQHNGQTLVSEAGMYHLIFQSQTPAAKEVRAWLAEQVMPSVRKSGVYLFDRRHLSPDAQSLMRKLTGNVPGSHFVSDGKPVA